MPRNTARGNRPGFHAIPLPRPLAILPTSGASVSETAGRSAKVPHSDKRQRVHKVDTRWGGVEYAFLVAASQAAGLTKGGYIRALVLGCPGPRSLRTPSVNAEALARATAELSRVGNNINQVARRLNSARVHIGSQECSLALAEVRAALTAILRIVGREPAP